MTNVRSCVWFWIDCRVMSACRCSHSSTCWRVIFMMFKCSLTNSGIKQHSVTSCTDQVLITSDECVLVPVRAERRRTQKLQLGTNQLQLLLWSLSSWDQRNSVFHCSSTKSLTGCFTWTSSKLTARVALSEWVGAGMGTWSGAFCACVNALKQLRYFWQP